MKQNKQILRVANIIEEGKLGGPQIRIANVAHALTGKVETTVILPKDNSEKFVKKLEIFNIKHKIFCLTRITKEFKVAIRYIFLSLYEIVELVNYFRRKRFDLIHVSGGSWQYKGIIAGKLAGVKVVWHLNDTFIPWLFRRLFGFFSRFVDGYIFSSERTRKYYSSIIKNEKVEFSILPPVDSTYFCSSGQYTSDLDLINNWSRKIVIGTVANINPKKGLDVFIRAASKVNKMNNNIIFVIIGPIYKNQQRYFEKLKNLCDRLSVHNIKFVGGRMDVRPLLQRFDVFVCSSYTEAGPMTLWEAMSMGKAVVSTDVGDVSVYIKSGYSGEIVGIGDIDGMTQKIMKLVLDEEKRMIYGKRARQIVTQKLDLSICADKHFSAYQQIGYR